MSKSIRRRRQSDRAKARSPEVPFDVSQIKNDHFWLFGQIYAVLSAFADDPEKVISRIGGGTVSIPDDQANDLGNSLRVILQHYPGAVELKLVERAARFDEIFTRKSAGGEAFDEWFWTNAGFERHPEWDEIRAAAREFLIR
jgi:hypothetical protein